ncbi:MAG: dolichyl-phosphate beta-glucosyltransferase [Patescibacteria group bacterium]
MQLSIVIPAYNEGGRITTTLESYCSFYQGRDAEIIVILNGCRDATLDIVKSFRGRYPNVVRFKDFEEALGKGGAVHEGFKIAKGEFVGFLDADGSTAPEEFQKLTRAIDGADGAIASRWKQGSIVEGRKHFRKIVSLGFVIVVRILFWLPFNDTQCGAKVFKRKLIDTVLPELVITNMAFDVELLYRARKHGFSIKEIPSHWIDKSSSTVLGSPSQVAGSGIGMLLSLIRIRLTR